MSATYDASKYRAKDQLGPKKPKAQITQKSMSRSQPSSVMIVLFIISYFRQAKKLIWMMERSATSNF